MPYGEHKVMADVFVEWTLEPALSEQEIRRFAHDGNECRDLYNVRIQESLFDEEGRRLICHFRAPDAESVRMALRCVGVDIDIVWSGTIYDMPKPATGNVVVERKLNRSVLTDKDKAIDAISTEWFDQYGFKLVRAIISLDGTRMICLYDAPDAESISLAQNQSESLTTSIWSYRRIAVHIH